MNVRFLYVDKITKMDLLSELTLAKKEVAKQQEQPIIGKYYDIDDMANMNVPYKKYIGSYLQVQSDDLSHIKQYYIQTFGIEFEDESDLQRRVNNSDKPKMYRIIDPNHRYDYINIAKHSQKEKSNEWTFISHQHRIVSNNDKLFRVVINKIEYDNGGTMARLGLLNIVEPRQIGQWYCLDIRKHIDFNATKHSDGIVSFNIGENTVYYSYIHKLWGMNWSNFKVIYKTLIGHDYSHQEVIVKRLEKTSDGEEYAVIDEFNKKILKADRQNLHSYRYISDDNKRIVSNNELLFNNYLSVAPLYRRGYRLTLS